MVTIGLKAEMGNVMFQYAIGRIIAEKKGYKMSFDESLAVANNKKEDLWRAFPETKLLDGKEVNDNVLLLGHDLQYFDIDQAFNHPGGIQMHGYWQKHYYYFPYQDKIKEWFRYDDSTHERPHEEDVVLHIRGKYNEGNREDLLVPIPLFLDILRGIEYRKCVIVTNDPDASILKQFEGVKDIVIRSKSKMEDFTFMRYAKRLIMSQSTFSWWAAFLGDAEKVYVPISIRGDYPCPWKMCPAKEDIDLIPIDNKYVKVRFNE